MKEFLLIICEDESKFDHYSPKDFEQVLNRFLDWTAALRESGSCVDCLRLTREAGVTARKGANGIVIDGPYAETKEVITGFFRIRAGNFAEAARIASLCPTFEYGGSVQIREIEDATANS